MKPLAGFFLFGALMAGLTAAALLTPGGPLEFVWRLKPAARDGFAALGFGASAALMATVSAACAAACFGLWRARPWGVRVAQAILAVNLVGDILNATLGHDPRAWIGIPVALLLLVYLARKGARLAGSRNLTEDR